MGLDHLATEHQMIDLAILMLYILDNVEEHCANSSTPAMRYGKNISGMQIYHRPERTCCIGHGKTAGKWGNKYRP